MKFLEDPQYMPLRVVILAIVAIVLGWSVITPAKAQDRLKTFQLHKEITEDFVGCIYEADALAFIKDISKGGGKIAMKLMDDGRCRQVNWPITYKEFVGAEVGLNGEHITVYRGQVKGKDIYVPMVGFTHQVI